MKRRTQFHEVEVCYTKSPWKQRHPVQLKANGKPRKKQYVLLDENGEKVKGGGCVSKDKFRRYAAKLGLKNFRIISNDQYSRMKNEQQNVSSKQDSEGS